MASENVGPPHSRSRPAAEERARWLARLRAGHGVPDDLATECYRCGGVYPRRALVGIEELPGYRWPRFCPPCAEEIRRAHSRACALCGATYLAAMPGEGPGLCPSCYSAGHAREWARVRYHLDRAEAASLPATLTLAQWLATLRHFGHCCAYCRTAPFTDLDHFIPLGGAAAKGPSTPAGAGATLAAGTTAGNCVPACSACNSLKRAADPTAPGWDLIPPADVARVRAYLEGLTIAG